MRNERQSEQTRACEQEGSQQEEEHVATPDARQMKDIGTKISSGDNKVGMEQVQRWDEELVAKRGRSEAWSPRG